MENVPKSKSGIDFRLKCLYDVINRGIIYVI